MTLAISDGPEKTVTVKSDETEKIEKFITNTGEYDIRIYIDSNLFDIVDKYEIEKDSNGNITAGEIHITITKRKRINWKISYSD